ncbi:MAG: hypothetical protein M1829_006213 [Trizodia sp. TS-e1964]|nr:MAG: hypothetical protein M1829_006213 [Trizodia sp. TS-e1964]
MPLILLTGYPTSGKSSLAQRLSSALLALAPNASIHILSSHPQHPRTIYASSTPEKAARAAQYATIQRLLTPSTVLISDDLNYIKGFRYQLYCEARAQRTPSCVVHVGTSVAQSRANNQSCGAYDAEVFEALVARYEEPHGNKRWDSPLFTVLWADEDVQAREIWAAISGAGQVRPTQATVLGQAPAREAGALNYVSEATQAVVKSIGAYVADHPGEVGGEVVVSAAAEGEGEGEALVLVLPQGGTPSLAQLQRLRRQFINLNRTHVVERERVGPAFVEFLGGVFAAGEGG